MKQIIGIDFGTSNTCISYLDKNYKIQVLKYNNMNTIPSVISFNEDIKCGIFVDDNNILREFKTKVLDDNFIFNDMNINQILTTYFKFLKNVIEGKLGKTEIEIIASVPSEFTDKSRKLIKKCYINAGFKVNRLINEPTAAALSFGLENYLRDEDITDEKIMVVDIGGGTSDFSILEIDDGFFEVVDSYGINNIGGKTINYKLEKFINNKIKKQGSNKIYDYKMIEVIKRKINILDNYNDDNINIDRRTFERIILDIIIKYEELFNTIKSKHRIKNIIMVGGGSNLKVIQEIIIRMFGNIIIPNPDLNLCVAKGCCYYLAHLNNMLNIKNDITVVDVNPLSLGVELSNGNFSIIIPKNTPIPTNMTQKYTIDNNDNVIKITVYQGERKIAKDNIMVGIIEYNVTSKTINPIISISFKITLENIIHITIINESNLTRKDYTLENKIDYDFIEEHINISSTNYHEDIKKFKLNEKKYLATMILENKINNINNNMSLTSDVKNKLLTETFNIIENLDKMTLDDIEKIIKNNVTIVETNESDDKTDIDIEIKNDMIKNRRETLQKILNELLLIDSLSDDEIKYIEQIEELLSYSNVTSVELDNMINLYDFIKRKNYMDEFNYLVKYLKDNIEDFDLSDEKKKTIQQYLEECIIIVKENKEYKKYIKKINEFCEKIYNQ